MSYRFALLDPRPTPEAREANEKVLQGAFQGGKEMYGIEVTVPELSRRCIRNIDPQHEGQDATHAAIEVVMAVPLPSPGTTLVTVRPDVDSIGSMAVLSLRAKGFDLRRAAQRIGSIAVADTFSRGGWPGPRPLPNAMRPWDDSAASAESFRPLAAVAAMVADFKMPLTDRVIAMEQWLLTGVEPPSYRAHVERERLGMITALETGEITYGLWPRTCVSCGGFNCHQPGCWGGDGVAWVESTHRSALAIGYALEPVVVALNPQFAQGAGKPYRKFTVCSFQVKHLDMPAVLAELRALEPGWGGSPTIVGSPQGVASTLDMDEVVAVVRKHRQN